MVVQLYKLRRSQTANEARKFIKRKMCDWLSMMFLETFKTDLYDCRSFVSVFELTRQDLEQDIASFYFDPKLTDRTDVKQFLETKLCKLDNAHSFYHINGNITTFRDHIFSRLPEDKQLDHLRFVHLTLELYKYQVS